MSPFICSVSDGSPLNRTLAITTNLAFIAGGSLVAELCLTGESSMLHLVHLVGFALAIAVVVAVKGLCILERWVTLHARS